MKLNSGHIVYILLIASCSGSAPDLNCSVEIDGLKATIGSMYDTEIVEIQSRYIQEEIYFDPIIAIVVTIENATTRTLDLKALPEELERMNNFFEIEERISQEARPVAELIARNCAIDDFNDIMVIFQRRNGDGEVSHSFYGHFDDLTTQN